MWDDAGGAIARRLLDEPFLKQLHGILVEGGVPPVKGGSGFETMLIQVARSLGDCLTSPS